MNKVTSASLRYLLSVFNKNSTPNYNNTRQPIESSFTIEVAKQELLLTTTHVNLADLLRTSRLGTNEKESEHHFLQALQKVARLENLTFLEKRPSLLYNLRIAQAAAHLGLGRLYRDQNSIQKALEQLNKAHDLPHELIINFFFNLRVFIKE